MNEIKKYCIGVQKGMETRKTAKFNIGDDCKSAVNEAKNGLWSKPVKGKKPKSPLNEVYKQHAQTQKQIHDYKQLKIA